MFGHITFICKLGGRISVHEQKLLGGEKQAQRRIQNIPRKLLLLLPAVKLKNAVSRVERGGDDTSTVDSIENDDAVLQLRFCERLT